MQTTLLKLMEETEVPLSNPMDIRGQMKAMMNMQGGGGSTKDSINTRHILFIVSGAFSGLEKVVRRRLSQGQIGFGADPVEHPMDAELFREVETQDFLDFGFEAEFIGRLPVRVICEKLTAKDLENILKYSEGSLLRQYEREFEAYGIDAKFEDSAIAEIAALAETENTGARALMTVCERLFRDFKFELPGTSVTELKIDGDLIARREEILASYRELGRQVDVEKARRELETFRKDFRQQHGVDLVFSDEAVARLAGQASEQGRSLLQLSRQRFRDAQFGLKLIQKNTGQERFELGVEAVDDPDKYLSDLVVQSYRAAAGGSDGPAATPCIVNRDSTHAHGHPVTAAAVVGTSAVALMAVLELAGLSCRLDESLLASCQAAGFSLAEGVSATTAWSLVAAAVIAYALAWLLFETPGILRRLLLVLTVAVLASMAAVVLALWGPSGVRWGRFSESCGPAFRRLSGRTIIPCPASAGFTSSPTRSFQSRRRKRPRVPRSLRAPGGGNGADRSRTAEASVLAWGARITRNRSPR